MTPTFASHLSLALALLLAGCQTIPRQLWSQGDERYAEVRLADWRAKLASQQGTLRVLLVHGMNNHPFGIEGDAPHLGGQSTYAGLRAELERRLPPGMVQQGQATDAWFEARICEAVDNGWADLVDRLAARFGHVAPGRTGGERAFELVRNPATKQALGYVLTREFPAEPGRAGIKFYIANWAMSVAEIKEAQFGSWGLLAGGDSEHYEQGVVSEMDARLNRHRAKGNRALKLHTVNWGLGDPSLYLTKAGPPVRRVVATALRRMAGEADPQDRAALIAASLGSTVALDCATAFLENRPPEGLPNWSWERGLASRQMLFSQPAEAVPGRRTPTRAVIYLFANQWALLTMGRERADTELKQKLASFDQAVARTARGAAIVQLYGFTDPNDLLSYPLNPQFKHVSTCNVYVRNPGLNLFGLLMHPGDAHVNYEHNRHVVEAMFDGPKNVALP